ncbi:MAG: cobyrinate a,c-diamide synthase [Treponema sp.]|jgi:cobyrinic acid a,c-diamide synthase|nr:cobyrinate a,c-diamide synthase [Treponema sp.]
MPRICIGADASGSGKTTLTCALLRALKNRSLESAVFKCGPDYIDPLFHREVTGTHSSNLDLYFFDEATVKYLLRENSLNRDIAVIEGVMGYYDGMGGALTDASTYHLASVTETPVILVENCGATSLTIAARVRGLAEFRRPSFIRAVILNGTSERFYRELAPAIEAETGLPVLGYLPRMKDCVIESRHLGLVTAVEIEDLGDKIGRLAEQFEKTVDLQAILDLAKSAPPLALTEPFPVDGAARNAAHGVAPSATPVRIGVARDRAFCFYYEDSLNLLRKLGAEILCFSPLEDAHLPNGLQGLYLGGGYPELYGARLAQNSSLREDIRSALGSGMPCIAECGGFMYLHEALIDGEGNRHAMAGFLPGICRKQSGLVRFGYAAYTAKTDTLLCARGDTIRGHEFHYWDSDSPGEDFLALKPVSGRTWSCIQANENLFAGFPHVHFYTNPAMAQRFLTRCEAYGR